MDVHHLRYFLAVARELNFTRAAASLHMTVPPLSQRIRSLEAELGCPLFDRSTHHTRLTDAGERLVPLAGRIVADVDRIPETVRAPQARPHARMAVPDALDTGQRRTIARLLDEQADSYEIEVRQVASLDVAQALVHRAVDLAFSRIPATHPALAETIVSTQPLAVICDATHFPPGAVLRPADLNGFTLVGGPAHWDLRSEAERARLLGAGVRLDPSPGYTDVGGMLLVLSGRRRFTMVPAGADLVRAVDPAEFAVHPVNDDIPPLVTRAVYRSGEEWITPLVDATVAAFEGA
ncbi:LysR family transcriptional regulator [Tsukamurella sp. 8F]|uniref:LysR family transcriptional regulator n=1 Tax=unclassified Tsukamurella TaxID=2633480 RepID=UPI0023B9705F|nr:MULTISPECIES: LysR family transcriptional regulator [unclassified Tsukamurella]MDF0530370.1 LysR family transcriptional regulator [Tsukamurella sp. 8J]MDF0587667.1 LysR family transcriptional regulator [Tsukamurella sp. 8F]